MSRVGGSGLIFGSSSLCVPVHSRSNRYRSFVRPASCLPDQMTRTSRDAPTGHKLFNCISFSLQPRRWAHIKRSAEMAAASKQTVGFRDLGPLRFDPPCTSKASDWRDVFGRSSGPASQFRPSRPRSVTRHGERIQSATMKMPNKAWLRQPAFRFSLAYS